MNKIAFQAAMQAYDLDDLARAIELMTESAMSGHPRACYFLALWNRSEEFGPIDERESDYWMLKLRELANSGDAYAQWELGQALRFGDLFPRDAAEANRWLRSAAENEWPDAQHHLAWYLETGQEGFPIDKQAAEDWYRRAFAQGHPETVFIFAMREFQGETPSEKAIALLQQAASDGFAPAVEALQRYRH